MYCCCCCSDERPLPCCRLVEHWAFVDGITYNTYCCTLVTVYERSTRVAVYTFVCVILAVWSYILHYVIYGEFQHSFAKDDAPFAFMYKFDYAFALYACVRALLMRNLW